MDCTRSLFLNPRCHFTFFFICTEMIVDIVLKLIFTFKSVHVVFNVILAQLRLNSHLVMH